MYLGFVSSVLSDNKKAKYKVSKLQNKYKKMFKQSILAIFFISRNSVYN